MKVSEKLRPVDLARAVGLSAQTVRKYERWGFIPPSDRGANGYRHYGPRHLQALRSARTMIAGFTWSEALRILRYVHQGDLTRALSAVGAQHSQLHRERLELEQSLGALRLATNLSQATQKGRRTPIRVGEAARQAGVEVSALRFWEQEGLLHPRRDAESGYRLYDEEQLLRVQVIALLRRAGYGVEALRPVLDGLAAGRPEQAVAAAEQQLRELAEAARRQVAATAALEEYLREIGL